MAAGFDRRILGAIRATLLLALCAGFVSLGISWLLSEVTPFLYTWDEALHSFRTGAVMGLVLFPLHQYYLQGPGGAWIRRMGFVQGMLMREAVLIGAIVLLLLANRAITATYIACPGGCSDRHHDVHEEGARAGEAEGQEGTDQAEGQEGLERAPEDHDLNFIGELLLPR